MNIERVMKRVETAWAEFHESYAGLTRSQLLIPGVAGRWSVRDTIAHVTWWEEEALKHLPLILEGGRPARYSVTYGGIDAFNALMAEKRKDLSLADVLEQQVEVHARLIDYLARTPEAVLTRETRFRRRLRLDTYGHYPIHTKAIREWRGRVL